MSLHRAHGEDSKIYNVSYIFISTTVVNLSVPQSKKCSRKQVIASFGYQKHREISAVFVSYYESEVK